MLRQQHRDLLEVLTAHFPEGIVTTREANAVGVSADRLERAVRSGALHRVRRGVYAVREDPWILARVEVARLAEEGIVSAVAVMTAAAIWGVPVFGRHCAPQTGSLTLAIPRGTRKRPGRTGRVIYRTCDLADEDIVYIDGLPVTSPLRTGIDVARSLGRDRPSTLIPLCGAARVEITRCHWPLWTPPSLASADTYQPSSHEITEVAGSTAAREQVAVQLSEALARAPRHGTTWIKDVLDDVEPLIETAAEALAWARLTLSPELPRPVPQAVVRGASGRRYRGDFLIAGRVILEVDGAVKYADTTPWQEKQRQSDLEAAGYWIVRCTWAELLHSPAAVIDRIWLALTRSAA